jgi:hypothetical protein
VRRRLPASPRRPGRRRPLFGDARADMALARADMSARNNLKLNAFVTLVYQKPGRAIPPHRVISSAGSPLGRPLLGWPGEPLTPRQRDVEAPDRRPRSIHPGGMRIFAARDLSGGSSRCDALIRTAPTRFFSRNRERARSRRTGWSRSGARRHLYWATTRACALDEHHHDRRRRSSRSLASGQFDRRYKQSQGIRAFVRPI